MFICGRKGTKNITTIQIINADLLFFKHISAKQIVSNG
jgi:hypothetical protein